METRANHMIVGSFVIAFFIGALAFVVWLAKFESDQSYANYNIIYRGDVTGLKPGSPVRYHGVNVGEVVDVALSPDKPAEEVVILLEVEEGTPVKQDTTATLQLEGITGVKSIQLTIGNMQSAPLVEEGPYGHPVIQSKTSALDQLLEGAPELVSSANVLLARGNDLLNDQNRVSIALTLKNIEALTKALAEKENQISGLIDDTAVTASNMKAVSVSVKELTDELRQGSTEIINKTNHAITSLDNAAVSIDNLVGESTPEIKILVQDFQQTARSFASTSNQVEALIRENREPLQDFTSTGLYEFSNLLSETRTLVRDLQLIAGEIERDPARFFFGDKQKGFEPPE
ncbi:MlaD family protein [uncultured Kiloniella sp.]|uniref:MlaD family protein n=1 Tax=uncultured Kiloniella sp. TaxID=1133091 RepID=UPI002604CD30|nr:MlaD family protein [uncultured Kiloniella sp.]